jgi:hypothetical protein
LKADWITGEISEREEEPNGGLFPLMILGVLLIGLEEEIDSSSI